MSKASLSNQYYKSPIFMLLLIAIIIVISIVYPDSDSLEVKTDDIYKDSINIDREDKYIKFADTSTSRFSVEEISMFTGFKYFEPDINYRVNAKFTVDTTKPNFEMKTSTDRTPTYRTYGYLDFTLNDTAIRLYAYQNMAFIDHPEYGNYLFIPFKDRTNTITTYGSGRYIDIDIPEESIVIIDFNAAYNPYCAYYDRWSCPLVPFENHLDIHIYAGEKKYK
ncbi:MAG: DUF1684 domain-containing protein [Bacteroidetes bacterium]|jgi:uncharacterized protein (DUF1684 family)|nr:DUF1684 domain-containing protein [Bacteroidota bacterium]